jgi:hypothetical protein
MDSSLRPIRQTPDRDYFEFSEHVAEGAEKAPEGVRSRSGEILMGAWGSGPFDSDAPLDLA